MRQVHVLVAAVLVAAPMIGVAQAGQQLIPTPYPEILGPNSMETPIPQHHYHQRLVDDPAPAANGPNWLGNPRVTRRHYHQRLIPDPYDRTLLGRYRYWAE